MTYFFLLSLTFWTYALILSLWTFKPRSDYTYVATVHPDTVMHWDTFHKKLNCILTLTMLPRYSPVFSRLYILLYIHMQNLLNWADRASTVPNRSSNEFSGKNGALPAQTMTIPVTTGANRDATVLNLGLYRPITGANRGGVFNVLG